MKEKYLNIVKEELKKLDREFSTNSQTVTTRVSPRLKSVVAYYKFKTKTIEPIEFVFSEDLFTHYSDEQVIKTIRHEYAHYYVNSKFNRNVKHGKEWIEFMENALNIEAEVSIDKKAKTKYSICCSECGKLVATREVLKKSFIDGYLSGCCKAKLEAIKNV